MSNKLDSLPAELKAMAAELIDKKFPKPKQESFGRSTFYEQYLSADFYPSHRARVEMDFRSDYGQLWREISIVDGDCTPEEMKQRTLRKLQLQSGRYWEWVRTDVRYI